MSSPSGNSDPVNPPSGAREDGAVAAILTGLAGPPPTVLMVHSSFQKLAHAGLRPEAFCGALRRALPTTTLLMPTMTWRTVTPRQPVFDELATPSETGVLTETFRREFATHRSPHPTHSVAGCGPHAATLLASHHLGNTPCAGTSPYGLLRDYDAQILMLGIDIEYCTAIHHAEEVMAPDLYLRPESEAETYELRARSGRVFEMRLRRHRRVTRTYDRFRDVLAEAGELREGRVADCAWMMFAYRDLMRAVFAALIGQPARCPCRKFRRACCLISPHAATFVARCARSGGRKTTRPSTA